MRTRSLLTLGLTLAAVLVPTKAFADDDDDAPSDPNIEIEAPASPPSIPERLELPPEDPPPQRKLQPLYRVALEGGPFVSILFGLGWHGPHVSGALVRQHAPTTALHFGASVDVGEMPGGLRTGDVKGFVAWEKVYGRLRVGVGGGIAVFWMSRLASDKAGPIYAAGLAGRGFLTFDVVRFDETRALYLAAVPELELLRGTRSALIHGDLGALFRASACVGVRF